MKALVLLLLLPLSGCFFVFIPGALIQAAADGLTGAEGEHCVSTIAKVGDRIGLGSGQVGTVASLSGASMRCRETGLPIRAKLDLQR